MSIVNSAKRERQAALSRHYQQKNIIQRELLENDFKFIESNKCKESYKTYILNTGYTKMTLRCINDKNIIDILGNLQYSIKYIDGYEDCYLTTKVKKDYGRNKKIIVSIEHIPKPPPVMFF